MGNRPEWCSRCVFEDCILTDHMAQYCEVSTAPQGAAETSPFLENKSLGISQTLSNCWFKRWSQSRGFLMKPEKIKWWTGYHLHKLQDVEWLYEEVQEAGHWAEWHKE